MATASKAILSWAYGISSYVWRWIIALSVLIGSRAYGISSYVWRWIVALSVLIGIGVFLYPKVSVTPWTPLQPSNSFSAPFLLSNDGNLPINAVEFSCALNHVRTTDYAQFEGIVTRPPRNSLGDILAGEKATIPCAFFPGINAQTADITILISFRPDWFPWRREEAFRFQTSVGSDGQFHWFPQPEGLK